MTQIARALSGGFDAPVFDAQSTFRILMDAMARPGSTGRIRVIPGRPEALSAAQAALALTLADPDTPLWLSTSLDREDVRAWLSFHTGAITTNDPAQAAFAFVGKSETLAGFASFNAGSQDYPDRSTTVIAEIAALDGGEHFEARGPGIDGAIDIAPTGLPEAFLAHWQKNRALFPRGIDLILTAGESLLCLPRSTKLTSRET